MSDSTTTEPAPPGRSAPSPGRRFYVALRELVIVVVLALGLSLVVKTWLLQAFYIPSGSMEDTLERGDRVIVSKLTPTVFDLQRGDVVVFSDPGQWLRSTPVDGSSGPVLDAVRTGLTFVGLLPDPADEHLIKRLIGLPGDHVVCCDTEGRLTVNDVPVAEPYIKPGDEPSGVRFDITVPADRIWVMGDHRSNSEDSRFHPVDGKAEAGAVPIADVTGRAVALVWPFDRFTVLGRSDAFDRVPAASGAGSK